MWSTLFVRRVIVVACFLLLTLAACVWSEDETAVSFSPLPSATTIPAAATELPTTTVAQPIATELATSTSPPTKAVPTPVPDTPTPTPAPAAFSCSDNTTVDMAALPAPVGLLRVLFLNDDLWLLREETGTAEAVSSGGNVPAYLLAPDDSMVAYIQGGDLWLWRDGQPAVQLTEVGNVDDLLFSHDSRVLAFSRALEDDQYELWAVNSDGGPARLLATASAADTWLRNPEAVQIDLRFRWASDTHILVYHFAATLDEFAEPPPEPSYLVNADTGLAITTLPGVTHLIARYDDTLAFMTQMDPHGELHLINLTDGRVEQVLPTRFFPPWTFSPDGRYLISAGGLIFDLADLSQRSIPIEYAGIGVTHASAPPPSLWADETTWYVAIPEGGASAQPGETFTLWRVNVAEGTVAPVNTFSGFVLDLAFSPDRRRLAFWEETGNGYGFRNLHLVDITTGQDEIYESGRYNLGFDHWLSDSTHFGYSYGNPDGNQRCFQLGHISQPPIPLLTTDGGINWIDDTHLILSKTRYRLYFQTLDGRHALIGNYLPSAQGKKPHSSFTAYIEQP